MAIKLTPGILYFIRDKDFIYGDIGKYVKIGIVTKERTTEERIKNHQTGNPRGIYPVDEVFDVPFVERLETQIHYEHNDKWISGEWFLLTDDEVEAVVKRAEHLRAQQVLDKPVIEEVLLKIGKKVSNGKVKKANKQALNLEKTIIQLKGELNICRAKIVISKYEFYKLLGANGSIEGVLKIKYTPSRLSFDEAAFKQAHPRLYKKFVLPREDKFNGPFSLSRRSEYSLANVDKSLDAEKKALGKPSYRASQLGNVQERTKKIEALHLNHLILFKEQKRLEYEIEILEYKLQKLVGDYDGIEGICSWKRHYSTQDDKFNATALKEAHPKLYETFVTKLSKERFVMDVEKCRPYKPK